MQVCIGRCTRRGGSAAYCAALEVCCGGFGARLGGVRNGLLIVVVGHRQIMVLGNQRRVAAPFADYMQGKASCQFGLAAGEREVRDTPATSSALSDAVLAVAGLRSRVETRLY